MTRAEALAEARRRWGPDGAVRAKWGYIGTRDLLRRDVGILQTGPHHRVRRKLRVLGWGDSWEAAFEDADRREKGGAK